MGRKNIANMSKFVIEFGCFFSFIMAQKTLFDNIICSENIKT